MTDPRETLRAALTALVEKWRKHAWEMEGEGNDFANSERRHRCYGHAQALRAASSDLAALLPHWPTTPEWKAKSARLIQDARESEVLTSADLETRVTPEPTMSQRVMIACFQCGTPCRGKFCSDACCVAFGDTQSTMSERASAGGPIGEGLTNQAALVSAAKTCATCACWTPATSRLHGACEQGVTLSPVNGDTPYDFGCTLYEPPPVTGRTRIT